LEQVCSSKLGINEALLTAFREKREDSRREESDLVKLTIEECVEFIIKVAESESTIFLIIDGLDECDSTCRYKLLSAFETIDQPGSRIKLAISSRDDGDLVHWQKSHSVRSISANQNQEEIKRFIDLKVSTAIAEGRLLYGDVSDSLKRTIVSKLTEKAERMYAPSTPSSPTAPA
jgi:hypothetical protein